METEKILLIQFGGLGDMILITPAIRALSNRYPNASISILGFREYNCRFLLNYKNVNEIKEFNIYDLDIRQILKPRVFKSFFKITKHLRQNHYDLLISFRYLRLIDWLFFEWLIILMCKAKYRIGVNPPFLRRTSIYDQWLMCTYLKGKHFSDFFCDLLEHAGIDISSRHTEFPMNVNVIKEADRLLSSIPSDLSVVSVHTGGVRLNLEHEAWDTENYIYIVENLIKNGVFVVVLGSNEDIEQAKLIALAAGNRCLNLTGKTSVEEMAAIIKRSKLFIGSDSGPFHVAVAVGTAAIGIFTRKVDEPEYYLYANKNVFVLRDSEKYISAREIVLKKASDFLT